MTSGTRRRRSLVVGAALLLAAQLLAAGYLVADTARDDRWRQDLQYLATELPARHVNLFFRMSQADFERAVNDLNAAIPTLTDAQVMAGLARIVAMAGDGHTALSLSQAATAFHRLPIAFYWFEDGLYMAQVPSTYPRALGARVIKIGDTDVQQAYQELSTLISHDNDYFR